MARRFWGREDPIGRAFIANGREHRVIGVAGDGKYFLLTEAPRPLVYLPMGGEPLAYFALHIRTSRPPETLLEGVAAGLRRLDPNLPAPQVRTLREHMRLSQYPATIAGVSIGLFGMLALVMALTGIYGVMARTVRMRTHELGIRAALGATGNAILKLVLARGLRILAAGLAIGVGLSLAANRLLAGLLVGIEPDDAPTLVAVAILLGAALLLACYIPANRAARRNVAECLRHE
jgi:ABC-type antimicrobial peptide transport system permease subunit